MYLDRFAYRIQIKFFEKVDYAVSNIFYFLLCVIIYCILFYLYKHWLNFKLRIEILLFVHSKYIIQ